MGYSCRVDCALVLDAVQHIMERDHGVKSSNGFPSGFWERGREQDDGSITGSVFRTVRRYTDAERAAAAAKMGPTVRPEWVGDPCRRAGSFKIAAGGKIVRFPGLTAAERREAEARGAMMYAERYGNF